MKLCRPMNVEIGTEAAQFPEKEYINGIFFAVCSQGTSAYHAKQKSIKKGENNDKSRLYPLGCRKADRRPAVPLSNPILVTSGSFHTSADPSSPACGPWTKYI